MKALKIIGWTLLGLVLTVVAVACIAMYVVFTPARLTPIARQAADKFIACPYEIGEVDLTFFQPQSRCTERHRRRGKAPHSHSGCGGVSQP